jgi:hypothetical protein
VIELLLEFFDVAEPGGTNVGFARIKLEKPLALEKMRTYIASVTWIEKFVALNANRYSWIAIYQFYKGAGSRTRRAANENVPPHWGRHCG